MSSPFVLRSTMTGTDADAAPPATEPHKQPSNNDIGHDEVEEGVGEINESSVSKPGYLDTQQHAMYVEALAQYPTDDDIDPEKEKRVLRKIDMRIIPLLGICYFFYYVDKTTL